jgi:hypothetical protein
MWNNFKSMPLILKLLTVHSLMCSMAFVFSIIPNESLSINGQPVTYAQWWASGVGAFASVVGLSLPLAAWLILRKSSVARPMYLACLIFALVLPYLIFWRSYANAAAGILLVALAALYLYKRQPVLAYFGGA